MHDTPTRPAAAVSLDERAIKVLIAFQGLSRSAAESYNATLLDHERRAFARLHGQKGPQARTDFETLINHVATRQQLEQAADDEHEAETSPAAVEAAGSDDPTDQE